MILDFFKKISELSEEKNVATETEETIGTDLVVSDVFTLVADYEKADIKKLDNMVRIVNKMDVSQLTKDQTEIISMVYARYFTEAATCVAKELDQINKNNKHDKNKQYNSYHLEKHLWGMGGYKKESIVESLDNVAKSTGKSLEQVGQSIEGVVKTNQSILRMQEANMFLNKLTPAMNERIFNQIKEERIKLETILNKNKEKIEFTVDELEILNVKYKGDMSALKTQVKIVKDIENQISGVFKLEKKTEDIEHDLKLEKELNEAQQQAIDSHKEELEKRAKYIDDFHKEKELNAKQEAYINELREHLDKRKSFVGRLKIYGPAYAGLGCGFVSMLMQFGIIKV